MGHRNEQSNMSEEALPVAHQQFLIHLDSRSSRELHAMDSKPDGRTFKEIKSDFVGQKQPH